MVHRFDFEDDGTTRKGMEDLCSLLTLRPEQKYESTWERVVGRIKGVTPQAEQQNALSRLADLLLLTYALLCRLSYKEHRTALQLSQPH